MLNNEKRIIYLIKVPKVNYTKCTNANKNKNPINLTVILLKINIVQTEIKHDFGLFF